MADEPNSSSLGLVIWSSRQYDCPVILGHADESRIAAIGNERTRHVCRSHKEATLTAALSSLSAVALPPGS
jgi:hypothetical protein